MDKNQAMIDFLIDCPVIAENPLFFNFGKEEENNNQFQTHADDVALQKPYIDGSVLKEYTFSIISYKAISYNPIVKLTGYVDENLEDLADVQAIIDWVSEQAYNHVYPNFGNDIVIEEMELLTDKPVLNGVNTELNPPIAIYSMGIKITYIDYSKTLWNK